MYQQSPYAAPSGRAAVAYGADTRERFLVKTYNHLFGAIALFTLIEIALFKTGLAPAIAQALLGTSWLVVMGGFLVVAWIASRVAHSTQSLPAQYLALLAYVVVEAIIFVPLLFIADRFAPGAIQSAALVTILGFAGLTGLVFWTRKDFSFLGAVLRWIGFGVLALIIASVIFGFSLGTLFSVGMVVFAGAAILYDTSNVLHHYPEDRYVGAALELFASVALLFWYVLRIFISSRD
ncbi:MAG: permease [Polyangiaceae bacterium]|nr:permease [Polyangiaceae bacterium]